MYIILNTYKYVNCVCVCEWACVYVFMTHDYEFQKKFLRYELLCCKTEEGF